MGTWGTAISSNDTYSDIYSEFIDLYDDGLEPSEISRKIIRDNNELIEDSEDKNNFWFALAMAQWQCKSLDPDILQRVKTIIESGEDIKIWEQLGADKQDIKKRIKSLNSFLNKLSKEKDKPLKRKRKVLRDSIFQQGDCLTFKFGNDNYGGAFVLTSEKQTKYGMNLIAITTINQKDKPTIDTFKKASVLIRKEQFELKGYRDREMISWYYAQFFKKSTVDFEVIGRLKVDKDYIFDKDFTRTSQWDMIKAVVELNDKILLERGEPKKKLKLRKLRKKHWL